jgi:predicted PurR-regulated permease PerM
MPMPTDRNVDYSLLYVLLALVVIVVLAIVGPSVSSILNKIPQNVALQEFETAFRDVQHPAGTERLALRTEVGDFADGERGCDFFVGQVRAYDGDQESILAA